MTWAARPAWAQARLIAQAGSERGYDVGRVVRVGQEMEDGHQQHGGGPGEVQRPGRFPQDHLGVAQVRVDVAAGAVWGAGEQRAGMCQHQRLRTTMLRTGLTVGDLAECAQVDTKTGERWNGCEVRLHSTTLYASLFRYDDEILVNPHVYAEPASANPTLHLRRLDGGKVADQYMASFERVWGTAMPWSGSES